MSFATIGAVWFAHTVITEHLDHADSVLIRLNLLLLLVVSFLPFPTKLLAEFVHEPDAERIAATVYGLNLLLTLVPLLCQGFQFSSPTTIGRKSVSAGQRPYAISDMNDKPAGRVPGL